MAIDLAQVFSVERSMVWLTTNGIRILGIVVGAFVITGLTSFVSHRTERLFDDDDPDTLSEREKRAATLGKVLRNVVCVVVSIVALLMILRELGLDIAPLLTGVGIAGIAVGFGAQSIVKDFLAGIFILIEDQFDVGDVINAADRSGLVEKITLRTTTLRDLEGKVHVIPNGQITVVTNMTKKWSRFVIDIGVAYKEDVDRVMGVLQEVGDEMAADSEYRSQILEPLDVLGVQSFSDSAVDIRVMFTTVPLKQWGVGREFRRRVKKAFDQRGIEIPFPHRTVYLGEGGAMHGRLPVELVKTDSNAAVRSTADAGPETVRHPGTTGNIEEDDA